MSVKFTGRGGTRITVNDTFLKKFRDDIMHGRIPAPGGRTRINDDVQVGLQIHFYKAGDVVFNSTYHIGPSRPVVKIGEYPEMSLQEAREMTKTIRELGERGVDVQDGYRARLIRELKEQGSRWRPWEGYEGHEKST